MEYTRLGRTELKVSVAGLGCGGFSRIGQGTGKSDANSISIIRKALDLGVNFIDTAAAYGTESKDTNGMNLSFQRKRQYTKPMNYSLQKS
jgi:aryl-alcohol dehydrogenase-like predicted oxidoreductase